MSACDRYSCDRLSLEAAVRDKYCVVSDESYRSQLPAHKTIKESAITCRPGSLPVQHCRCIILDHGHVTHVESSKELATLCPSVNELDLSANLLSKWRDVCSVLESLPQLAFLNLSNNPLNPTSFNHRPLATSNTITTLVLNSTGITWSAVHTVLQAVPRLQELHLSKNEYSEISLPPSFSHPHLKRLHINSNPLSEWTQVEKLGTAFPKLETLIATSLTLSTIPLVSDGVFPKLKSLSLNSSQLSNWESVDHLKPLPQLTDLCISSVPLGAGLDAKERRMETVARMPHLQKLNKSKINSTEREEAERWFLRKYTEQRARHPQVYDGLVAKHGTLAPLADIILGSLSQEANLVFDLNEQRSEVHKIRLDLTTNQLRDWICKQFNLRPSTFRLWYIDPDNCHGGILMKWGSKRLATYHGITDGHKVLIQIKLGHTCTFAQ